MARTCYRIGRKIGDRFAYSIGDRISYRISYRHSTCSNMPLAVSYVMEAFLLSWAERSSTCGEERTTETDRIQEETTDRRGDVQENAR